MVLKRERLFSGFHGMGEWALVEGRTHACCFGPCRIERGF